MGALYTKPKGMRYVDLCMWIDDNFYKEDCDRNKAFEYMYIIAYMLACKKKWFTNIDDYDGYAYLLAYSTYKRMSNTENPIKSVLNYMKSIMGWRKILYQGDTYKEVIDPDFQKSWNEDLFKENTKSRLESSNNEQIQGIVNDLIEKLPLSIKKSIPDFYTGNKLQSKNIYTSVLLSLLYEFTLPCVNKEFLERKEKESITFNSVDYYNKHLSSEIILWGLPESMRSTVQLVINRVKQDLLYDIREVIDSYKISDTEYNNLYKDLIFGDSNEANYENE